MPNLWWDGALSRHRVVAISVVAVGAASLMSGCTFSLGSSTGAGRTVSANAVVSDSPNGAAKAPNGSGPNAAALGSGTTSGSAHSGAASGANAGSAAGNPREYCSHVLAQFTIVTDWAKGPSGQDRTQVYRDLYAAELAAAAVAPLQLRADAKARLKVLGAVVNAAPAGLSQAVAGFGSPEYLAATVREDAYLSSSCGLSASPVP